MPGSPARAQADAPSGASAIDVSQSLHAVRQVDQVDHYELAAAADRIYLLELEQDGLDFVVDVDDAAGRSRRYNSPLRRDETEIVLIESGRSAPYRISVFSEDSTYATGRYTLRVEDVTGLRDADVARLDALRSMSRAAQAHASGAADDALEAYSNAASVWRRIGDSREAARCDYASAMLLYMNVYDWQSAATRAGEAAAAYARLDLPVLHANADALHAAALIEAANGLERDAAQQAYETALEIFDRSARLHAGYGNDYGLGHALNNIGLTHYYSGDDASAQRAWQRAAPIFSAAGEWQDELFVRQNLAVIETNHGYHARAIESFEYILAALPPDKGEDIRTVVLDNLGSAYREAGRAEDSLRAYTEALAIHRRTGESIHEANALWGLGSTYFVFGELDTASVYLTRAHELARAANEGRAQAGILTSLGNVTYAQGDYDAALGFHRQALASTQAAGDRALRLVLVARDLAALGRHREAIETATAASETVGRHHVTLADALLVLGNTHLDAGDADAAVGYHNEALAQYNGLGLPGGRADALMGLARAEASAGNLRAAIDNAEEALEQIESVREQVASPTLRALFGATRHGYYDAQIGMLMELARAEPEAGDEAVLRALTTSERARSRMTMELVAEATANLAPPDGPRERQRELRERLAALNFQRDQLAAGSSDEDSRAERIEELLSAMAETENELNLLEGELRQSDARYAGFVSPATLSAEQVQAMLDEGTILVQYALGSDASHAWVVGPDFVEAFSLPDRATVEAAALRAFENLSVAGASAAARRELDASLSALAEIVVAPFAGLLRGERILVAADGALQYVPFGALPIATDGEQRRLIDVLEVVGIPSMSVLAAQRRRDAPETTTDRVAIFADAVFDAADTRLAGTAAVPDARSADAVLRSGFGAALRRLPATRAEAEAIEDLVPANARLVATGFDANRDAVLTTDLSGYRYVHLATHGLVDSRYPALSGLMLSRFDENGRERDGLLRLHDIYSLNLGADLVVLSACDTALGREVRGEGLIGLTQAFMYAGAGSLVVSLWQVDDRATAELMRRFYSSIFEDGARPAEALRAAQISMAETTRWNHPYFWSAFVLVGDWR